MVKKKKKGDRGGQEAVKKGNKPARISVKNKENVFPFSLANVVLVTCK